MNYKISTGIFATTTLVFALAFGLTFVIMQKQPDMLPGAFPGGEFPRGDSMGEEFASPPFCECPEEEVESTEDPEEALL